jgi:predicted exporter
LIPITLLFSPIKIQTDIFSLLPSEEQNPIKKLAFDRVAQEAGQKIIVLFANTNKDEAYKTAVDFYQRNQTADFMKDADFYMGNDFRSDINSDYFDYRYHLLSSKNQQLLHDKNADAVAQKALKDIYSPMSAGLLGSPKDDPFLLFNDFFMSLPITQSSLFPYNDVLMTQYEGKHYAFLAITLPHGMTFSITELADTMEEINVSVEQTKIKHPDTEMILTGVPVHSYHSSKNSQSELSTIGNISLFFTVLLIYFSFKSLRELFLALFAMGMGCVMAFAVTHLVFQEVHLITLIFGTSLIGVAIDYSFPFFCEFLDDESHTGDSVIKHIYPGLTMGLCTSLMGYAALMATPFPGLQQMACFSVTGLIVAYLIVVIIYPRVYKNPKSCHAHAKLLAPPSKYLQHVLWQILRLRKSCAQDDSVARNKSFLLTYSEKFFQIFDKIARQKVTLYILVAVVIFTVVGLFKLSPSDDIKQLYTPEKDLMAKEILTRKVMGQYKASQFFLVEAKTPEELLAKEELLGKELDGLVAQKALASYNAISQIVPSLAKQKENYGLIKNELMPNLDKQAAELGIAKTDVKQIREFFAKQEDSFLSVDEVLNHSTFKMLKPLWLGQINGSYASVVLLNNVADATAIAKLNQENSGVYFMDKVSDISNIMEKYRHFAIRMLIIAYAIIFVVLYFRYGLQRAALVFFPPVLAGLLTLAIIGFCGYPINLFNILGLFLVLGFGIDYTVFFAEGEGRKITTSVAIFLSFLTNILSFGLLAVSDFPVIHSFGLVMLLGMLFAYLFAPIVTLAPTFSKGRL